MLSITGTGYIIIVRAEELSALCEYLNCIYEYEIEEKLDIGQYKPLYNLAYIITPDGKYIPDNENPQGVFGVWYIESDKQDNENVTWRLRGILEKDNVVDLWCEYFEISCVK